MKRSGFVITESIILALIGLLTAFISGAVVETETDSGVTKSINYTDENVTRYPTIIITDI